MALYIAVRLEHRYDNGYIAFWALKQNVEWTGVGDTLQTVMTTSAKNTLLS